MGLQGTLRRIEQNDGSKKPLEMRTHDYHFHEQHAAIDLSDIPILG